MSENRDTVLPGRLTYCVASRNVSVPARSTRREPWSCGRCCVDYRAVAVGKWTEDRSAVLEGLESRTVLSVTIASSVSSKLTQPDTLNLTTHLVLGNGYAAMLDRGLQLLANSQGWIWPQMGNTQRFSALDG